MIDLLVAGGGPAGLATAVHAARAGMEVVVVERRRGVIDKACGEGLMPHSVQALDRIGAQVTGRAFHGITYLDGRRRADARFRSGAGLGVRRTMLHAALVEAATAAGVRIEHGEVTDITQNWASVSAAGFRARYLAAADGLHSPIRRTMRLAQGAGGRRRWGISRHIHTAPWSDSVEVHWSRQAEAYVTPVADDCVGVVVLTSTRGGFTEQLGQFSALSERIAGAPHGRDRAAGPLRQKARDRRAGRVLLVGDAAGYVDALTGEGLGLAFAAAELLVDCVTADHVDDYDLRWRRMTRRYRMLTAALLHAGGCPPVRASILPVAAAMPRMFGRVVNALGH